MGRIRTFAGGTLPGGVSYALDNADNGRYIHQRLDSIGSKYQILFSKDNLTREIIYKKAILLGNKFINYLKGDIVSIKTIWLR